jgi:hypothetical protein
MFPNRTAADHFTSPACAPEMWPSAIDFAETDAQDDGRFPVLAGRFPITDPQHWLDLCA